VDLNSDKSAASAGPKVGLDDLDKGRVVVNIEKRRICCLSGYKPTASEVE